MNRSRPTLPAGVSTAPPGALLPAAAISAAFLMQGTMIAAPGATLDALAANTGASLAEIGGIFGANGLGFVGGAAAAARLYSSAPGTKVMGVALLGLAGSAAAVPLAETLPLLVLLFGLAGFAIGLLDVGGNTIVPWLFGRRAAPYMNGLQLAWGVGAFAAPLLVAWLAALTGKADASYWAFASLMAPVGAWLLVSRSPRPPAPVQSRPAGMASATFVVLMAALFFFHVGAQLAFGGWVFTYAEAIGVGSATTARVLNSLFWGGLVVGRALDIPVSTRVAPKALIWLDLAGAAAALGLVAASSGALAWAGTALFGFSIASLYGSCLNHAAERMEVSSRSTAAFIIGGSLGSMSLPWLVGAGFETAGPTAMTWVVGGALAGAALVFASLARARP